MRGTSHRVSQEDSPRGDIPLLLADALHLFQYVADNPFAVVYGGGQRDDCERQTFEQAHVTRSTHSVFNRRSRPAVMAPNAL
jgi:hypothetical protein